MMIRYCANCGVMREDHESCNECRALNAYVYILTTLNRARLAAYANRLPAESAGRRALIERLESSRIVPPDEVPPHVATLNARVTFQLDNELSDTRVLVPPDIWATAGRDLRAFVPLGLALLGLSTGCTAAYRDRQGGLRRVLLLNVDHQPEAANRASVAGSARISSARFGRAPDARQPNDPGPSAA